MDELKRGNVAKDYKEDAADISTEPLQVSMWRARILRAKAAQRLHDRVEDAKKGDEYLEGTKSTKNAQKIYIRYLLPLLEDLHRRTLPEVPTPRTEATSGQGWIYETQVRQFITSRFDRQREDIKAVCTDLQWDDDRLGNFVGKIEWKMVSEEARPTSNLEENQLALEIEKAQTENTDPLNTQISSDDIDVAHVDEHQRALLELEPASEEYMALDEHIQAHVARLTVVKKEEAVLSRIRPWQYVYEPDLPWAKRGWEAELKSEKVQDLIAMGFRNLNKDNAPPEKLDDQTQTPNYEDLTVQVWDIHDRRNGMRYVISAKGSHEGYFLKRERWPYGEIDTYYLKCFRPYQPEQGDGIPNIQVALEILDKLAEVDFYIDRHVRTHASYKPYLPIGSNVSKIKSQMHDPNAIGIDVPQEVLASGIKEYKPPPIPDNLLQQKRDLLGGLRRAIGLDAQDVATPNPHQITARETSYRGEQAEGRKMSRQDVMAAFLSWIGMTELKVYKKFATLKVPVKVESEAGIDFVDIDPRDLPLDIEIYLDVKAETDEARAAKVVTAREWKDYLLTSPMPIDHVVLSDWYGRELGVRRPERFRLPLPVGPENIEGAPEKGMSGMSEEKTLPFSNFAPKQSASA